MSQNPLIRYIVNRLNRICDSTIQRFNDSTRRRHSSFSAGGAFTLIELIVVIAVIGILVGLVLSTVGYAQKKAARSRAETEIAAMSAACENYKADNGVYPNNADTNTLDPKTNGNPGTTAYTQASLWLYVKLSGDSSANRSPTAKSYMEFKPKMLLPSGGTGTVTAIADPFGNSYGYSTAQAATPGGAPGYNPTFDLWSTSGLTSNPPNPDTITPQWIKNW
ncbi:MAG: prepilin-type N-terminal cleavage/methylation domain-containing protein [Candidatus Udaeobacter sp.]